jgi:hypothetical protein
MTLGTLVVTTRNPVNATAADAIGRVSAARWMEGEVPHGARGGPETAITFPGVR